MSPRRTAGASKRGFWGTWRHTELVLGCRAPARTRLGERPDLLVPACSRIIAWRERTMYDDYAANAEEPIIYKRTAGWVRVRGAFYGGLARLGQGLVWVWVSHQSTRRGGGGQCGGN